MKPPTLEEQGIFRVVTFNVSPQGVETPQVAFVKCEWSTQKAILFSNDAFKQWIPLAGLEELDKNHVLSKETRTYLLKPSFNRDSIALFLKHASKRTQLGKLP